MPMSLRIATWNINSVRARADIVEQFLRDHRPDVLCLQETKVANDIFPHGLFEQLGYTHRILNGQRMHHGVATISRVPLEGAWRYDWQDNGEARHIGVRLPNGVLLENVYVPAGGDVPDREVNPKFGQKMDFIERMTRWSEGLNEPAVIVGDFNVAPLDCDVWNHKALLDVVSHTPMEVDVLNRLQQSHDWVDLGRHFNPAPEKFFTWWSYRNIDWRLSDRGRRLDHIWASPSVAKQATAFEAIRDARDWGKPSDHIPQIVTLDL
ncbi:exodeoxyribonuclease III [Sandarakinorhabdus limnophila]|uniref:exodeoxyribonuclease III n=1 Tax=Sandarakinorhabdus limnophila TaxID=210512 RepID=UPI0026EC4E3D|nr:exodeoxyribonuclease III [Sandarakinorhabdus limnophila]